MNAVPLDSDATFPQLDEGVVNRDDVVAWLTDSFGTSRKGILLHGVTGSGKTTLAAQFAMAHATTSLTYFVGRDHWTPQPLYFLRTLAAQLAFALGRPQPTNVSPDRLQPLVATLMSQFLTVVRSSQESYYLVIDSIDRAVTNPVGESISQLLPGLSSRNLYVLLTSSSPEPPNNEAYEPLRVPPMRLADTAHILRDCLLDPPHVKRLHDLAGGLPGYSQEAARLIRSGHSVDAILTSNPTRSQDLLRYEWDGLALSARAERLLAFVAFFPRPLDAKVAADSAGLDENAVTGELNRIPIVICDGSARWVFVSGRHLQYARERLASHRPNVESVVIDHLLAHPEEAESAELVPALLSSRGDIERLRAFAGNSFFQHGYRTLKNIPTLRAAAAVGAATAAQASSLADVLYYTLVSGLLTSTASRYRESIGEVSVLAALGDFDDAVNVAQAAPLPEDQLRALGLVAYEMRRKDFAVPHEVLELLTNLAEQVPNRTGIEEAASIAAAFFPILPDTAIRLIERCTGVDDPMALERALALLSLKLSDKPTTEAHGKVRARISSDAVRDLVMAHSSDAWLLGADEALVLASQISTVSGQLLYLRDWCNRNRAGADAGRVVARALDLVTERGDYTPGLRVLRQILTPVPSLAPDEARGVIARAQVVRGGLPDHPVRERILLDVFIAEQVCRWDVDQGHSLLLDAMQSVGAVQDLDVRSAGYATLLAVLRRLDPTGDLIGYEQETRALLTASIDELLANSAEHLDILSPVLRIVAADDVLLATRIASGMNTRERRDRGYALVAEVASARADSGVIRLLADTVLPLISDSHVVLGSALGAALHHIAERGLDVTSEDATKYAAIISKCTDPFDRARAWTWLGRAHKPLMHRACVEVSREWELVRPYWYRAEAGYHLAELMAPEAPEEARILLGCVRASSAVRGAQAFFAPAYADLVGVAACFLKSSVDAAELPLVEAILAAIDAVASPDVRLELTARVAERSMSESVTELGRDLSARVLGATDDMPSEFMRAWASGLIVGPLALCDAASAKSLLGGLGRDFGGPALVKAAAFLLARTPHDAPVDVYDFTQAPAFFDATTAVGLLSIDTDDSDMWMVARILTSMLVTTRRSAPLAPRQLRVLADALSSVADRLPDKQNIRHDGYRLLLQFYSAVLIHLADRQAHPAPFDVAPWISSVSALPNAADRSIVASWMAELAWPLSTQAARDLQGVAESALPSIPNALDRAHRLEALAESCRAAGDINAARHHLLEAVRWVKDAPEARSLHSIMDKVIDVADAIDPELAASITTMMDDRLKRYSTTERYIARRLRRQPGRLQSLSDSNEPSATLGSAAVMMRESISMGRATIQDPKVATTWLRRAVNAEFADTVQVASWVGENAVAGGSRTDVRVACGEAALRVATLASELAATPADDHLVPRGMAELTGLPVKVNLFRVGDRDAAIAEVESWIQDHATIFLIIVDPWFTIDELDILRAVPRAVRVTIVTGLKGQRDLTGRLGVAAGALEAIYSTAWRQRFDQDPPDTKVAVLATSPGMDSPIHDRYLFADGGALRLGTSLNGLGKRDSEIERLGVGESEGLRERLLSPWFSVSPPLVKGAPVRQYSFPLLPRSMIT